MLPLLNDEGEINFPRKNSALAVVEPVAVDLDCCIVDYFPSSSSLLDFAAVVVEIVVVVDC